MTKSCFHITWSWTQKTLVLEWKTGLWLSHNIRRVWKEIDNSFNRTWVYKILAKDYARLR